MTVSISGIISESNVNTQNNTSDVTVNLYANWNAGSWAADNPAGFIIIDGTQYNFTANFNVGQASTGSELIKSQTKTVAHDSEGNKTVACSASYDGIGSYTVTWSDSKVLTPIPQNKIWIKVSGVWKQATPYIKVSGVWKEATPYIKVSGTWKRGT